MTTDEGAEIIALPSATEHVRQTNEDERDLDALGLRHELDAHGYVPISRCWHNEHAAKVDVAGRRIYCGGCGAERDPFEVLDDVARRNANIVFRRRRLKQEIAHLEVRLEELKRQERNTKARIRTARSKIPIEQRRDGWPLCPYCHQDSLEDRENPIPSSKGALWCSTCRRVTMRKGAAAR